MPAADAPLLLASASPRRHALLQAAGFRFEVRVSHVEEITDSGLNPAELVRQNARLKAAAVAESYPGHVVLGADTVVVFEDAIFGKPTTLEEAERMLSRLNGGAHLVYSGVCILEIGSGREELFAERSQVFFKTLGQAERSAYLERIQPLDKAGAYAAQDDEGELIARIEGSRTNVIGLPMEAVSAALARFGIQPTRLRVP